MLDDNLLKNVSIHIDFLQSILSDNSQSEEQQPEEQHQNGINENQPPNPVDNDPNND